MWCFVRNARASRLVENTYSVLKETRRSAGHSKWSNIKHIKAEKDAERAVLFSKLTRQMRVAIAEEGSHKPAQNLRLAQVIEVAKKKSMPLATINGVLAKAASTQATSQVATVDVRGPGGCILIVEVISDNLTGLRMLLNGVFKKHRATAVDQSVRSIFDHKGQVVTEVKGDLDSATDDAIAVGAEDVEEIVVDGEKRLQFSCDGSEVAKVASKLSSRNYEVISREDTYVPRIYANLKEDDLKKIEAMCAKLEAFDEVIRIYDNIE